MFTSYDRPVRQAARVSVNLAVRLQVRRPAAPDSDASCETVPFPAEMAGQELAGSITNLSPNGACVELDGPVPPLLGRLAMEFELEPHGRLRAFGLVMWRRPGSAASVSEKVAGRIGVLFESLSLDARRTIAELVRRSNQSECRILVVEDSDAMRQQIIDALERLEVLRSVRVAEACTGLEAVKLLGSDPFDIVLTDLNMPELDGFKLIRRIRADPRHKDVPILVITSGSGQEDQERAMELGANAFLTKPFTKAQIFEAVRGLFKHETLSQEDDTDIDLAALTGLDDG